jgi:hypothetical protein
VAFEEAWEHGETFIYGAVNAGGPGIRTYGDFCLLVENPEDPTPFGLAVFPADTVKRYTNGGLQITLAEQEAAAWSERAAAAVVALWVDALAHPEAAWPRLVCGVDAYLETPRAGALPIDRVDEVRMGASFYEDLVHYQGKRFSGEPLQAHEWALTDAFRIVQKWRAAYDTSLTVVPDSP